MRSSICEEGFLLRWLLRATFLIGLPGLAACSSDPPSDGDGGGGSCTADTSSDILNCGMCGHSCTSGQACVGGSCRLSCVAPEQECAGMCANPASNALHCGGCNVACGDGQICQNSMCMTGSCPTGTLQCNGACTDTQTHPQNCGACNNACLASQTCQAGTCVGGSGTGGTSGAGGTTGTGGTSATGGTGGDGTMGGTGGDGTMGGTGGDGTMGGTGGSTAGMGGTSGSGPTGGTAGKGGTGGTGGTTGACRVWLATNGVDTNPGTEAQPVLTLLKAYDLMCPKPPDGTPNGAECLGPAPRSICVKSGTYNLTERLEFRKTRMGTASNRLILQADPSLSLAQRPIFNFASQPRLTSCGAMVDNMGGLTVNAHYVTVKNLIVRNANDTCILVQGTQGLIENVLVNNCADTGIQISAGGEFTGTGTNNTIRNCDSHTNNDTLCNGENADGFAIKEGTGTGNVFSGCRSWNNADDGFDFFAWTSPVRLENSWAFDQTRTTGGGESDGNGFKLGGDGVSAAHQLSGLFATGNTRGSNGEGFTRNSNPASMSCSGCASWGNTGNGADGISGLPGTAPSGANVTNMAADGARNADGSLKAPSAL